MDDQFLGSRRCSGKVTDKIVRFCKMCNRGVECVECKFCDKYFNDKTHMGTTSFHQIGNDLTRSKKDKAKMICDLGCPNSVIGAADVDLFRRSLSEYQQGSIELVSVDENFKFGPSGPYHCSQKLRIPIGWKSKTIWVDIAIVKADIPMLLGNNILKPLEAEIKLFSSGNGVVVLDEEEIDMKETAAGHYTVDVSDLGKLCYLESTVFECELFGEISEVKMM